MDEPNGNGSASGTQAESQRDGGGIEAERPAARRVRCPRHGFTMEERPADPVTGAGRILRCTVDGCRMVARLPGAALLRERLTRKQREWAAARDRD